eukprot:jgi/Bigna1/70844/fgenesh1_pg.13_\
MSYTEPHGDRRVRNAVPRTSFSEDKATLRSLQRTMDFSAKKWRFLVFRKTYFLPCRTLSGLNQSETGLPLPGRRFPLQTPPGHKKVKDSQAQILRMDKTAGQVSVEAMVASSTSPMPDSKLSTETKDVTPQKKLTAKERIEKMRKNQRTLDSELSDISFTKEEVNVAGTSPLFSPNGSTAGSSALATVLQQRLESKESVEGIMNNYNGGRSGGGDDDGDDIDDGLAPLDEEDDDFRANMESRYRSRTRSVHSNDQNRAVQAAKAYDITLASREHRGAGGMVMNIDNHKRANRSGSNKDEDGTSFSMRSSSSSSLFIGSTPVGSYNPHNPGTFQMSDKFRCTVHFSREVIAMCKAQAHNGSGGGARHDSHEGKLLRAGEKDHGETKVEDLPGVLIMLPATT